MKFKLYRYIFFAAIIFFWQMVSYAQTLSINEFMASNVSTIADEDGDFEDWIELHNYGNEPVDLDGWFLSDDFSDPYKWIFPDVIIQPGEFLLVWASGKDRKQGVLHTSFSIDASGEELLLVHPSGNWVDLVNPIALPTGISYGRKPDGTGDWFYFDEPTPGFSNVSAGYTGITQPPDFSHAGGFYDEEFLLEIGHPDPEALIIYTHDGSEPALENTNGVIYHYKNKYAFHGGSSTGELLEQEFRSYEYINALPITDRSQDPDKLSQMSSTVQDPDYFPENPVFKGTVIRARAFKEGYLPSEIKTHTFFITQSLENRFTLPVISIAIQEDSFFDYEKGIYTAGVDADEWREQNPGVTFSWPFEGNFRRRGIEWEYPANFEYFHKEHLGSAVNQQVGIRIHGGATRSFPMKSLRIYARNMYGQSHLNYPFFENNPHDAFKRLILRNSGNDFTTDIWEPSLSSRTLFRDAFLQNLVKHLNLDTQDYTSVILFVNGEYWGLHNIRERYDRHYLERTYGLSTGNIDLLTSNGIAKEGDNIHYQETLSYIQMHGLEDDEHYAHILTRLDEKNFTDYQIVNIFARNTDWPGNNLNFWRARTESFMPDNPDGLDGRIRWLLFDADFGFGLWGGSNAWEHNTMDFATEEGNIGWPNPDWSTFLLRSFLENETFRIQFINRFADLLNTIFLPDHMTGLLDEMKKHIAPEIPEHLQRWMHQKTFAHWEESVEVMRQFALKRPLYQKQHLKEFFGLTQMVGFNLDVSHPWHGHIKVNSIELLGDTPGVPEFPYPWDGEYFRDIPIEITAIAAPGFVFSHWEGDRDDTESILTITPLSDIKLTAHFVPSGNETLLHYWFFNNELPNNTPLEKIPANYTFRGKKAIIDFYSCLPGYPYDEDHEWWRKASMERRNLPTHLNYRPEGNDDITYDETSARALQIKQPMQSVESQNIMILHLPTAGAKDLVLKFAAINEGAADKLILEYSVTQIPEWKQDGLQQSVFHLYEVYQLFEADFSQISEANNNSWFAVRIRFSGPNLPLWDNERVTFSNISLDGEVCNTFRITAASLGNGSILPNGIFDIFGCDEKIFEVIPEENHRIEKIILDGKDVTDQLVLYDDHTGSFILNEPSANHNIFAQFAYDPLLWNENDKEIIVYPNPVTDKLYIASSEILERVEVFDLAGRIIFDQPVNSKQIEIEGSFLIKGIFVVRLTRSDGIFHKKISVLNQ